MASKDGSLGGSKNQWPLDLDTHDPEGIASFCLGLGYDTDNVVRAIVERCKLDRITARQIVDAVAHQQQSGGVN